MIPLRQVCEEIPGLTEAEIRRFIAEAWVRPPLSAGEPSFRDIDVARIRLIRELHAELEVEEPTLPIVLSLMDQLYAARRQLRAVIESLNADARADLLAVICRDCDEE